VKTILALLMMALSATAYSQLVKCVSKDGKIEYARECAAGSTEAKTQIRSSIGGGAAPAPAAAPAQKSLAERDAEFKKRMIEQQEAQQKESKKTAEAEQKRDACDSARTYLKSLESGLRMRRIDPKTGETAFIDDAERTAEAAKARDRIAQNCK
jgi:hypothetical protein